MKQQIMKIMLVFILIILSLAKTKQSGFSSYSSHATPVILVEHISAPSVYRETPSFAEIEKHCTPKIEVIHYMIAEDNGLVQNAHGNWRFEYLQELKQEKFSGLPITVVNQNNIFFGTYNFVKYLEMAIYETIHSRKPDEVLFKSSYVKIFEDENIPNSYQAKMRIYWENTLIQSQLELFHYHLFLIANEVEWNHPLWGRITSEFVAYDFIPFKGDNVSTYKGKGFPLIHPSRELDIDRKFIELKTEFFFLPKEGDIPREGKASQWSLHLFIEDPYKRIVFSKRISVK